MRRVPGQTEKTLSVLYLTAAKTPGVSRAEESEAAGRLLARLLTAAGHGDATVKKEKSGRPVVEKPGLAVSVTHTGGMVFCALLATEAGDPRLGIDAEVLRPHPRAAKLAARYFGPCEQALCGSDPTPRAFFACFTAKEAFAKYRGDGLSRHLSGDDTAAPDFEAKNGVRLTRLERNGVLLTICLAAGDPPTLKEL